MQRREAGERSGGKAGEAARWSSWAPLPTPSPGLGFQLHPPSGLGGANAATPCPHLSSPSRVPSCLSLPMAVAQPGDLGEPSTGSHVPDPTPSLLLIAWVALGIPGHSPPATSPAPVSSPVKWGQGQLLPVLRPQVEEPVRV